MYDIDKYKISNARNYKKKNSYIQLNQRYRSFNHVHNNSNTHYKSPSSTCM